MRAGRNPSNRPRDGLAGAVACALIALEPFLDHALDALGGQRVVGDGLWVTTGLHQITRLAPCIMRFLHAHRWVQAQRHAALLNVTI